MSKQPAQKILRIGLFQNQKFIEERLIHSRKAVTIGHALRKKNTFTVPVSKLPKQYSVFTVKDGKYFLHFNAKMSGRLSTPDGTKSLDELARSGRAKKQSDGSYLIPIDQKMYGRVAFGSGADEVALLFQFVKPPPPRPKPVLPASMRGGILTGVVGSAILTITVAISTIVQVGFVAFLLSRDWPEPKDIDYKMPDRFVSVMVEEEEEIETDEPVEMKGEEGPGEEEEAEEPAEEPSEEPAESDEPETPEERAAAEAERKRRMAEEVQNRTILGQIGAVNSEGGNLVDALSEGAGKTSMEEAFANSEGIKAGVAGAEKSGLRTSGSSAADGKGSAVGIGDLKGTKGAREAEKGVKTGNKRKEKEVKARIRDLPAKTAGGTLDSGSISRVIKRRQAQIQRCYEREIKKNPKARGKVVVTFTIGAAGRVTKSRAATDSVGGGVGRCVAGVIKRFRFPRPKGGEVLVNKTFVFEVAE